MKYLFLAYGDEERCEGLSSSERDVFENECQVNEELLRQNGHLLAAGRLLSNSAATTVRVQDGELCVTDDMLVSTKARLLGIFFIDARDLNNALYVASKMPQAHEGFIEVMQLVEFGQRFGQR